MAAFPKPYNWPHLTALVEARGRLTVSHVEPFGAVAMIAQAHQVWVALRLRPNETARALLERLEAALAAAAESGEPIDELGEAVL